MQAIERGPLTVHLSEPVDGCAALRVVGEVDITSAPALVQAFTEAEQAGSDRVVIDCSGLSYLDSSGVSALLRGNNLLGGERSVRLTGLDDTVRRILEVLAIDQVLDVEPRPAA